MKFTGLSFGVIGDKICVLAVANQREAVSLVNMDGLPTAACLSFIAAQRAQTRNQEDAPVFVAYDSAVDCELMLRDLSHEDKDTLYGITKKAEDANVDLPIYAPKLIKRHVYYYGFRLSSLPGKILRISEKGRSPLVVYDIASYFDYSDIAEASAEYLKEPGYARVERYMMPLWASGMADQIAEKCEHEAALTARLAMKIKHTIDPLEIAPRQWYGPSAIASRCLNKWGARGQSKRLTEKNSPAELLKAIDCAYIGGRVEQLKLGTVKDVTTYDINSAYAYATTLLSQFYTPLRFTRWYSGLASAPFSLWFVDYELPKDVQIGPMPTRSPRGGISFRRRGRGYFWQPEVSYLIQRFPDCFRVKWGYQVEDYQPVKFAPQVHKMYDYRNQLKAEGDAGQKIIKLALSNLYGKFAQNAGGAYYQCRAWAGWITSLIRRMLLEAVTGVEDQVICFCQDAVHFAGVVPALAMPLGIGLGEWKRETYKTGLYVSPGIYNLLTENHAEAVPDKVANRGVNHGIDFARLGRELSDHQVSELTRSFFVGWQLARQAPVKYNARYLSEVSESLVLIPSKLRARNYITEFDWLNESRDSTINSHFSGLPSARYLPQEGHSGALRLRLKDRGWA